MILIPVGDVPLYDTTDYRARFYDPAQMWESEMERARPVLDWPTDGIPTVRPNLGTIFVPALAGQEYLVQDGQMPWTRATLSREAIRATRGAPIAEAEVMRLAEAFYRIHAGSGQDHVAAYHPDTQGVFDIAHLLYGDNLFLDMMDPDEQAWVDELLEISLDLMVRAVRHVKSLLGEPDHAMIHGHATPQGVYFPDAGIRMAEDTATLVSPQCIERFILPAIERGAERVCEKGWQPQAQRSPEPAERVGDGLSQRREYARDRVQPSPRPSGPIRQTQGRLEAATHTLSASHASSESRGGVFIHFCGRHPALFEMLCRLPCVRAIDLGNPEMYDTRWLLECCAETDTVLHSRLAVSKASRLRTAGGTPATREDWEAYTRRLGGLVRETGARCILRPLVYPATRQECAEMKELWHDLTV